MKSRELLLALRDLLAGELQNYPFPSPESGEPGKGKGRPQPEAEQDVRVFLHGLPDDHDEKSYPFVVIRWVEGRIDETDPMVMGTEIVGLVIGVYAPKDQEQAGLLSATLLDAVRQIIWSNRLLAKKFDLIPPLRSAIPAPEKKWNQYHMATVESEWNYALPPRGLGKDGSQRHGK